MSREGGREGRGSIYSESHGLIYLGSYVTPLITSHHITSHAWANSYIVAQQPDELMETLDSLVAVLPLKKSAVHVQTVMYVYMYVLRHR